MVDDNFAELYQLAADMGGDDYIFTGENDANMMHNSPTTNLNILDASCKRKIRQIFFSSSACIYPAYNQEDLDKPICSEDSANPAVPDRSEEMISISQLVDMIADIVGRQIVEYNVPDRQNVGRRNLDNRLIHERLCSTCRRRVARQEPVGRYQHPVGTCCAHRCYRLAEAISPGPYQPIIYPGQSSHRS